MNKREKKWSREEKRCFVRYFIKKFGQWSPSHPAGNLQKLSYFSAVMFVDICTSHPSACFQQQMTITCFHKYVLQLDIYGSSVLKNLASRRNEVTWNYITNLWGENIKTETGIGYEIEVYKIMHDVNKVDKKKLFPPKWIQMFWGQFTRILICQLLGLMQHLSF